MTNEIKENNQQYNQLSNQIDELIIDLNKVKEEIGFDSLLKDLAKNKNQIAKNKAKSRKKDETTEVTLLIDANDKIKASNEEIVKKLSPVNEVERKLFAIKKNLTNKILTLDKQKNSSDFIIKKNTLIKEEKLDSINGNLVKELQKQIKELEIENADFEKQIEDLTAKEKPFVYLTKKIKYNESKINKLKSQITRSENLNKDSINNYVQTLQKIIDTKNESSDAKAKEIQEIKLLIEKVDGALTSGKGSKKTASFIIEHLDVWYGSKQALFDINLELPKNKVISIIGPSGCGKSTFLRTLNRINDNIPSFKARGTILLDGEYDIYKLRSINNYYDKMELPTLRTKVGMIFQQPNPFPMSIAKNVQYGPKVKGIKNKAVLNELTENSLKDAGIWDEVKDNLKALGTSLSGGQQQRLCIARAIANEPDILLMDEPTSALDPIATKIIEDLIIKLKKHYTIIMVTHSMQQAQRISDYTAYFYQGEMIEFGTTKQIFETPKEQATKDYITGKFG